MQQELIRLDRARSELLMVSDAMGAKRISDIAKGLELVAIRQKDDEVIAYAHRIHADALRLEGQYLQSVPKNTGSMGIGKSALPQGKRTSTLKDQGISFKESVAAQTVAEVANKDAAAFESFRNGDITLKDLLRTKRRNIQSAKIKLAQSLPKSQSVVGPYGLILADPPWQYEHCEANNREIENHYPTAVLEDIYRHGMEVEKEKDCILFLWATAPKLQEAISVMVAWGFNYRSCAVWDKQHIGMGYWWRIQHELLLVGTSGKPGSTPECERVSSIFSEARSTHSTKPTCVYEWIERAFPESKKVEMYCRKPREGWGAWGNEI